MSGASSLPTLPATLPKGLVSEAIMLRICRTKHAAAEPGFRAAQKYRFDSPDGSFGTCYAARDFKTCFFETIVRSGTRQIARSEYDTRSVAVLLVDVERLHLVPVHGDAGKNLGVNLNLANVAGESYDFTQALSKAIHDHSDAPHGIIYRSRFDDGALATVLFERSKPFVRLFPATSPAPLPSVRELGDSVRRVFPFELV